MTTIKHGITLFGAAIALMGCNSESTEETSVVTDPFGDETETDETGDTAVDGPQLKTVDEIRFRAFVAWDAVLNEVVSPIIDGDTNYVSSYRVDIYQAGWSNDDDNTHCKISLNISGTGLSTDAKNEGWVWGIDISDTAGNGSYETCIDKGWDPDQFEDDDPLEEWGNYEHGLRIGGDPTPTLELWLAENISDDDFDLQNYIGGSWTTSATAGMSTDDENNFWYASPMDDEHNVDRDISLTRDQMVDQDGNLVTGYFVWDQTVYWNFAD